jgi:hypothetical protein
MENALGQDRILSADSTSKKQRTHPHRTQPMLIEMMAKVHTHSFLLYLLSIKLINIKKLIN